MYHFCTYFDKNYLTRAVTLLRSLQQHCKSFRFYMFCLDNDAYQVMCQWSEQHGQVIPISLTELESWDKDLLKIKPTRSTIEYYFTLSPVLPLYVFAHDSTVDLVTYLDADLYFYSDPACLYNELGQNSIFSIEHRFPPKRKSFEKFGRFNVQYQTFRRDEQGLVCLNRWRQQCIDWCYDRLEDGKFADQKYLDEWPDLYSQLVISQNLGAGLAPWNIDGYKICIVDNDLTIECQALVFYHFHNLQQLGQAFYTTELSRYKVKIPKNIIKWLYMTYLGEMKKSFIELSSIAPNFSGTITSGNIRYNRLKILIKAVLKGDIIVA